MNKKARIGFLSAVLKIDPDDIRETAILNTNLRKEHADDKLGILDVRVLMNDSAEIDIEIHLTELKVWADRSLFYLSKMYVEQIHSGQDYAVFKKCVSINVLDFDLFKGETDFYSCFHIREDRRSFVYTDKMEFHVIELPKLQKDLKEDCSNLELWARFINAEQREVFDMLAQKDPYIASAYGQLQVVSQDREKRLEYEARQKAIWDYNQTMREARECGLDEGEKIGRAEGKKETAIKMLKMEKLTIAEIAMCTDLSIEEVKNLARTQTV